MNKEEIYNELDMGYFELCKYLQEKYGIPERPYMPNNKCTSVVQSNSRTKEGLVLHHIREYCCDNLGQLWQNHSSLLGMVCLENCIVDEQEFYWQCQQPEHLCYCTWLEHLLLHYKLNQIRLCEEYADIGNLDTQYISQPYLPCGETDYSLEFGGVLHIRRQLDDLYRSDDVHFQREWMNACGDRVRDNKEEYHFIVQLYESWAEMQCATLSKKEILTELYDIYGDTNGVDFELCLHCIENYLCGTCPLIDSCRVHGASWLMANDYIITEE